jgi:hypothetical protein
MPLGRAVQFIPALALIGLCACSSPTAEPSPEDMRLPTEFSLPLGVHQDCDCVQRGECVVVEQRAGHSEVRGLSCAWVRPGEIARCRFETRFVEWGGIDPNSGGKSIREPIGDPWRSETLRVRRLGDGTWCAL